MKKLAMIAAASLSLTSPAFAQSDAAEAMVASMRIANISYRDLMNMFSHALAEMQDGMIRHNPELVKQGANVVFTHPAPKDKPWTIMAKEDQEGFKQTLLAYDKVLDVFTEEIVASAEKNDWQAGIEAVGKLQGACIACHQEWLHRARR